MIPNVPWAWARGAAGSPTFQEPIRLWNFAIRRYEVSLRYEGETP